MAWIRKAPSGKWQARWRDPGGGHRVKTFRLKADAERFLVSIEDAMHRGAYHDPNAGRETLGAFWEEVRAAARTSGRLSERTLISYDEIWKTYLRPLEGHPLNAISRADVEDVVGSARSAPRARDVHKVLRAILGRAVKAGKIATNPAAGVELPKVEHREPRTLSAGGTRAAGGRDARPMEGVRPRRRVLVAPVLRTRGAQGRAARTPPEPDPRRGEDHRGGPPDRGRAEDRTLAPDGDAAGVRDLRPRRAPSRVSAGPGAGWYSPGPRADPFGGRTSTTASGAPRSRARASMGSGSANYATRARRWPWRRARTRSWWPSGWATPPPGWSSSTTPGGWIGPTRRSPRRSTLVTLRHGCGTRRMRAGGRARNTPPDLQFL